MVNKNNIVSIILFIISVLLFLVFTICIFFGGQKLGGAIYFVYFAIVLAFAFLSKKYASNFAYFYRFSAYIADAFNILAVASILYYEVNTALMISCLCLLIIVFLFDLFSKNRVAKRRVGSILSGVFNCSFMFCVFPYFFGEYYKGLAIVAVVIAALILVNKAVLAFVKYPDEPSKTKDKNADFAEQLIAEVNKENVDNDIE